MAYREARTQLNAVKAELASRLQAVRDTKEMYRHAGESLVRVDHAIETVLAEDWDK